MDWHIINHRDYIDGPFAMYQDALAEALVLGNDMRSSPRVIGADAIFTSTVLLTTGRSAGRLSTGSARRKLP